MMKIIFNLPNDILLHIVYFYFMFWYVKTYNMKILAGF